MTVAVRLGRSARTAVILRPQGPPVHTGRPTKNARPREGTGAGGPASNEGWAQAENELPQPQELLAFGLWNLNPEPCRPDT
jgi:hypothetical protein